MKKWRFYNFPKLSLLLSLLCVSMTATAKCGGVDYSWGADGLAKAHDFVISCLLYVVYLSYAVAGIIAVVASLQIYIKMTSGEEGVKKEIITVVGAVLFIISASIVMPALFGYQI